MANKLINEQSKYLLQHANNPVDWYPWGDEAFEKAKAEHKPVLVSIGYAACHWCHVMEKESFEDELTAAYMNDHFICIKVDREEHPDVDKMYMDALKAIKGMGGWPLNVFVTADRAPFYGGTYYPLHSLNDKPTWLMVLEKINEVWTNQQSEVMLTADQFVDHLAQASKRILTARELQDKDSCRKIVNNLLKRADKKNGGFGTSAKFPDTLTISFLLEHYHFTKYEPALEHALLTLDAMIEGGIYDHLAGGIARYTIDAAWLIPHFEKMLHDSAMLVCVLCDAYSITKNSKYKVVLEETIAFVEQEMKDASGGYYCALDADSEGVEGKFYTWTWEEWLHVLGEKDVIINEYFGVRKEGTHDGSNILHQAKSVKDIAIERGLSESEVKSRIGKAREQLMIARSKRQRPVTDDKCLLSWNALMNIALSKASVVVADTDATKAEHYLAIAEEHMLWMLLQYRQDEQLLHTWKNGEAKIQGNLDDHAYLIQALLLLSSVTGYGKWIKIGIELLRDTIQKFKAPNGFFYYASESKRNIPVRTIDVDDAILPSANAVMAQNLWICGMCMERNDWIAQSVQMLHDMGNVMVQYDQVFGYWALLLQRQIAGLKMIICSGPIADITRRDIRLNYLPQSYLLAPRKAQLPILNKKKSNYLYVCTENACLPPVTDLADALRLISQ